MAWLRELRCAAHAVDPWHCSGVTTVHHERPGGSRATDGRTVPLCVGHHTHGQNSIATLGRRKWQAVMTINLAGLAAEYEAAWQTRGSVIERHRGME